MSTGRAWILIACVVVVLSPALHSLTTAGGFQLGALGAGLVLGAITLAIYLHAVRRARRDVGRS